MRKEEKELKDYKRNPADLFTRFFSPEELVDIIKLHGVKPDKMVKIYLYSEENPKTGRMKKKYETVSLFTAINSRIDNEVILFLFESGKQPASMPPPSQSIDAWQKINSACNDLLKRLHMHQGGVNAMPWPLLHDWEMQLCGVSQPRALLDELYSILSRLCITSKSIVKKHRERKEEQEKKRSPDDALTVLYSSLCSIKKDLLGKKGTQVDFSIQILKILKGKGIVDVVPSRETFLKRVQRKRAKKNGS